MKREEITQCVCVRMSEYIARIDGWMTQDPGDLHEGNSGGYASSVR
jgi:hypothetical protein